MHKHIMYATLAMSLLACDKKPAAVAPPPVAAATAAAPADSPAAPGARVLSPESFGPVTFGAALADAEKLLDEKAAPLDASNAQCGYVSFKQLPDILFMVENGIVTRADARQGVPNIAGIDIGAPASYVRKKYPAATVTPHQYVPGGHYLAIPGKKNAALVFEDDGSKVTAVRAGIEPSVTYPEGCS